MGIGRFVYTPILPLMHAQAGLPPQLGAELATANYLGYLIGALAAVFIPALTRSQLVLRLSLLLLAASLALMPATHAAGAWLGLRLVAGIASALIFVIAVSALFNGLRAHAQQLVGWGFGGVGAGIALSGGLVLALRASRSARRSARTRPGATGSPRCWPATPSKVSATSWPERSWSPPSTRAGRPGPAASRGCWSGWRPCPPPPCGRG
jgi:MFS family permease